MLTSSSFCMAVQQAGYPARDRPRPVVILHRQHDSALDAEHMQTMRLKARSMQFLDHNAEVVHTHSGQCGHSRQCVCQSSHDRV